MEDYSAVQLTLCVIIFEYYKRYLSQQEALMYAKYLVRNFQKALTRMGQETPKFVELFISNMNVEIAFLEEDIKTTNLKEASIITQEELTRIGESLHYLKIATQKQNQLGIQKTVHPIHFDDYSGEQFERLTFAYVLRYKTWDKTPEWLGQVGSDSGRDIWAVCNKETYCYACANYKSLTFAKAKSDIDKLIENEHIPNHLFIVGGSAVSAKLRAKIIDYGKKAGAETAEIWTGVEFEEKLRHETPNLIKRFVEGETFPDSPSELINYGM